MDKRALLLRQLRADGFAITDVDVYARHECHLSEHVHRQHGDDFQHLRHDGADRTVHRLPLDKHGPYHGESGSAGNFTLYVREPNRTVSALYSPTPAVSGLTSIQLNGSPISPPVVNGYAVINRTWAPGDYVDIVLPMPVQRIKASTNLTADAGLVALQYGPLIYNIESADQTTGSVLNPNAPLSTQFTNILGGFMAIKGNWTNGAALTAIPNYARLNRGGSRTCGFGTSNRTK